MKIKWNDTYQASTVGNTISSYIVTAVTRVGAYVSNNTAALINKMFAGLNPTIIGEFVDINECIDAIDGVIDIKTERLKNVLIKYTTVNNNKLYSTDTNSITTSKTDNGDVKQMGGKVSFDESNNFDEFVIDSPSVKQRNKTSLSSDETKTYRGVDTNKKMFDYLDKTEPINSIMINIVESLLDEYTNLY